MELERIDMRLEVLCFGKNLVLPLRLSKALINKRLDCYCPFLNSYYLTSHQIFNYIWSYKTPIEVQFVALER